MPADGASCRLRRLYDGVGQIQLMHGLEIATDRLGYERPRTIDPGSDPDRSPACNVAAKAGRDLNAGVDVPVCEPLFEIGIIGKRRFFDKVGRAAQLLEIGAAFVAMVVVENGEGEIVYVGRDAEAKNKHQKRRAEQGKAEPDRIAQQFQRFADRAGEKALQTEGRAAARGRSAPAPLSPGLQRRTPPLWRRHAIQKPPRGS